MLVDRLVHIVDADAAVRAHGATVLGAAGYHVKVHPSGGHFMQRQPDRRPGCVLLDIQVPEPDGLNVLGQLIEAGHPMPVVVFTGADQVEIAVRAMRAGALHFLEKPYSDGELLTMVEEAFDRLVLIEIGADRRAEAAARLATLSPRETQVAQGMLAGLPNKLIAHKLGLSIRTVEMYRTKLLEKLQAKSLSALFRLWLDAGRETTDSIEW